MHQRTAAAADASSPLHSQRQMHVTRISVVIPTYNRGPALATTITALLRAGQRELSGVEIIVVDDGSPVPAEPLVAQLRQATAVSVECVRQENRGPAAARNTGFRRASGEVVLFLDDDILSPPDLLVRHLEAHRRHREAVVCGRCTMRHPSSPGAFFRAVQSLGYDDAVSAAREYAPVSIVASGQLSVERSMFDPVTAVYRDGLTTPAAEEYELSARLRRRGIPILFAQKIVAVHDSPLAILDVCRQQYKHGLGCAEAACRCPETLELQELAVIVAANDPSFCGNPVPISSRLKSLVAGARARAAIVRAALLAERYTPQWDGLRPLYRLAIAAHFSAGVRDGLRRFEALPI